MKLPFFSIVAVASAVLVITTQATAGDDTPPPAVCPGCALVAPDPVYTPFGGVPCSTEIRMRYVTRKPGKCERSSPFATCSQKYGCWITYTLEYRSPVAAVGMLCINGVCGSVAYPPTAGGAWEDMVPNGTGVLNQITAVFDCGKTEYIQAAIANTTCGWMVEALATCQPCAGNPL